jgi:hypothetical protein
MDENKKNIIINPNHFNVKTQKKRVKPTSDRAIKIKTKATSKPPETLKRKSILKMIRAHHEERNKQKINHQNLDNSINNNNDFNNDFKNAQTFFENLAIQQNNKIKPFNHTLKNYNISTPITTTNVMPTPITTTNVMPTPINTTNVMPTISLPKINNTDIPLTNNTPSPIKLNPYANIAKPLYGCLKNGNLPTYKTFMNQTRKQNNIINGSENPTNTQSPNTTITLPSILQSLTHTPSPPPPPLNKSFNQMNCVFPKIVNKPKKHKKIIRRTYKVGKCSKKPTISVLLSNKTIRNRVIEQTQLLKQTSIHDIKKYLIKHGFIRIGTTAPNDVLRKIYESTQLISGEVYNHNPENLLYNFLNEPV